MVSALLIGLICLIGCGNDVAAGEESAEEAPDVSGGEEEAWGEAASEEEARGSKSKNSSSKSAGTSAAKEVVIPKLLEPEASGTAVKTAEAAMIDYSHIDDGYVMVRYTQETDKRLKAMVKGPTTTYTYDCLPQRWETFPLSDGNGEYSVTVYENIKDKEYATVVSETFGLSLTNEFAPFLRPNQFVDYVSATETVKKAAELTAGIDGTLDKVTVVYNYVVSTLSYDTELAKTVQSGYLPVLDDVLKKKKGICFDYAAVMTGMLRSQGIPCKLVVGFAGEAYHAWISVWSDDAGWVDNIIQFDGKTWQRMDPTFASSAKNAESLKKFIGDNSNYEDKFYY